MGIIRDSFVIFKNWTDAINALPEEFQLETYKAVVAYGLKGEMPQNLSSIANAMLISFSKGMENSLARYNASVENGKKGGAPIGNKNAKKKIINEEETTQKQQENNLKQPKTSKNNLNVNDNVNVNNNIIKENSLTRVKESEQSSLSPCDVVEENSKVKKHKFGKFKNVLLTQDEYERLLAENIFGVSGLEAIEHLSYHREMKGYTCKNDNLAIRKWCFKAAKEDKDREEKLKQQSQSKSYKNKESPLEQLNRVLGGS